MKKYLSLEEIHNELLKMIKELVVFFENNKMTYFMWAGTFLGAVRHNGFIPWDDDVDFAMPRPEFDKLVNYLKHNNNKISSNLSAIGYELDNSDFPIIKIINKKIMIEDEEKCDEYLWIDIFPLDATPKDNKKFYNRVAFYNKLFYLKRQQKLGLQLIATNNFKRIIKKILLFPLKLWTYKSFLKFYYNYCTKYPYEKYDYVHNNVWSSSMAVFNKQELKTTYYDFEGIKVKGLIDYDKFLSKWYGDYMQLPPKEKRVTHNYKAYKTKG